MAFLHGRTVLGFRPVVIFFAIVVLPWWAFFTASASTSAPFSLLAHYIIQNIKGIAEKTKKNHLWLEITQIFELSSWQLIPWFQIKDCLFPHHPSRDLRWVLHRNQCIWGVGVFWFSWVSEHTAGRLRTLYGVFSLSWFDKNLHKFSFPEFCSKFISTIRIIYYI